MLITTMLATASVRTSAPSKLPRTCNIGTLTVPEHPIGIVVQTRQLSRCENDTNPGLSQATESDQRSQPECCANSGLHAAKEPRPIIPATRVASRTPWSHLRTSSTVARNVCGIVRPRAAAVLALMANSNLVGCSTGISPGFVPRRILSTMSAAFRNRSG
jgi:hypothetical protein